MLDHKGGLRVRRILVLFLVLPLALAACGPARYPDFEQVSAKDRTVIKFSHVVAENTPKGIAARRFAAMVKERSGGKIEVQVFPNSQLYGDGEEFDRLRSGDVQIIAPSLSKLADLDPPWQVFDLPYFFDDDRSVERVIAGATGQRLYAGLRRMGMEPVAFWHNGFKQISNARGSLLLPVDIRGLRFRIQSSPVMRDMFQVLGAEVSVRPFDSLYGALAKGELDGQENAPSNIFSKHIHEVQPYMTVSNFGYLGYVVLVNERFWSALAPDTRELLREAMADTTQWVRENARALNEEAMDRIRISGKVLIHKQTPNERELWRTVLEPVYRRAESRLGADVLREVLREAKGG